VEEEVAMAILAESRRLAADALAGAAAAAR
jgi:hypothetical protein